MLKCSVCNKKVTATYGFKCSDCFRKSTAAKEAKPESATTDCSADGSAAPTPTKPGVQPAGPEQLLADLKSYMKKEFAAWRESLEGEERLPPLQIRQLIVMEYKEMLSIIEGEAGEGQDDRSRTAG